MPSNLQPESMTTWMRDVERRLRLAESGNRLVVQQYGAVVAPNQYRDTTSATGESMWEFRIGLVTADAVSVEFYVDTNSTTVAGLRLVSGSNACDELLLTAGYEGYVRFDWIVPGLVVGDRGSLVYIEARVASGGGTCRVFLPQVALHGQSFEFGADATGNGRTI